MHKLPRMKKVESSVVKEIGYKKNGERLYVKFLHNGEKVAYVYHGVLPEQYKLFLNSDSKGQFFNSFIKNGYESTKIEKLDKKSAEKAWWASLNDVQKRQLKIAEEMIKESETYLLQDTEYVKKLNDDLIDTTEKLMAHEKYLQFLRDSLNAPKSE